MEKKPHIIQGALVTLTKGLYKEPGLLQVSSKDQQVGSHPDLGWNLIPEVRVAISFQWVFSATLLESKNLHGRVDI